MFEVKPLTFIAGLTPELQMTCGLDQFAQSVRDVLALQIEKEEGGHMAPMAEVHVGSKPAIQATMLSSRMAVAGEHIVTVLPLWHKSDFAKMQLIYRCKHENGI